MDWRSDNRTDCHQFETTQAVIPLESWWGLIAVFSRSRMDEQVVVECDPRFVELDDSGRPVLENSWN